jgi:hypothetical protein
MYSLCADKIAKFIKGANPTGRKRGNNEAPEKDTYTQARHLPIPSADNPYPYSEQHNEYPATYISQP